MQLMIYYSQYRQYVFLILLGRFELARVGTLCGLRFMAGNSPSLVFTGDARAKILKLSSSLEDSDIARSLV